MTEHFLKVETKWLDRLNDGTKTCELRLNDRDYQVGDILSFIGGSHSLKFKASHVLTSDVCEGLKHGYCIISLEFTEKKPIKPLTLPDA